MPSLSVFIDICKALKISPDYLLQDELEENEISTIREIEALWKVSDEYDYVHDLQGTSN